jgi:hypothetical protein
MPKKAGKNISKTLVLPGVSGQRATGGEVTITERMNAPAGNKKKKQKKKKNNGSTALVAVGGKGGRRNPIFQAVELHQRARRTGNSTSDGQVMSEFAKDARLYADSLAYPEAHFAVKVPDGKMEPSVVIHPEFEAALTTVSGGDGNYYAGVVVNDLTDTIAYRTLSAVDGSGVFTWSSVTHPNSATIAQNFGYQRFVSQSVQVFDTLAALDRSGEFVVARIMDLGGFGGGTLYPTSWNGITSLPSAGTCPNTADFQGARLTSLPQEADDQPFKTVGSTSVTSSVLVIIWRTSSAVLTGGSLRARFFQNIEVVPYADKALLFSVSSDLGSPEALNKAVLETARMLSSMSMTVNAFRVFLESSTGQALLSGGRAAFNYLVGVLGYGPTVHRQRVRAEIGAALQTVRSVPQHCVLTSTELDVLSAIVSRLSEADGDPPLLRWEQVSAADDEKSIESHSITGASRGLRGPRPPSAR